MKIEVSNGELLDKLSILEIKCFKISNKSQLDNITKELYLLNKPYIALLNVYGPTLSELYIKLSKVNNRLWEIEDEIRICERNRNFGKDFVYLARSIYKINDLRSKIKLLINDLTDSTLVEEKSYETT